MPNIIATLSGWKNCFKSRTSPKMNSSRKCGLKKLKLHAKDLIFALERRQPAIA